MKKVICTDAECMNLTFKKEYEVLNEWKERGRVKPYEPYDVYLIIDDTGNKSVEPSCLFEDVDKEKSYNFREVIKNIQPREKYECEGFKIKCFDNGAIEIYNITTDIRTRFYTYGIFTKIEPKPVEFLEAWKAFEEGKTIESTYTLDKYKKIDGLIKIQHQGGEFEKCGNIATTEIGNKWIIID